MIAAGHVRLRIQKAISGDDLTTTPPKRGSEPELVRPLARAPSCTPSAAARRRTSRESLIGGVVSRQASGHSAIGSPTPCQPQPELGRFRTAAMRILVSDPAIVADLLDFLESRSDVVAERVDANELEVSMLGSYGQEGQRIALELLVQAWLTGRAARPVSVELRD